MYIKRHKKNSLKIKRYKKRNIANRIFLFTTLFFFIIFLPFYFIFSRKSKRSNRIRKFSTNYSSIIQNKKLDYDKELYEFKSFSEYFEDFILYVLLLDIKNGFYIDIGAYDPNKVSVTKAFYLRGWNGINIEPLPNQFKLFEKERPKDINLQMVIGNNEGNVTFYVDGQCSTVQKKYAKRNESINIKMDTMSNICKKYVPEGKEVDFCKIDVEGNERDVLLGYDFDNYKPKVFCVESTIPLSFKPNYQLWEEILIKNGFTFVYERGVNRYYVNKKFSDILNRANNIRDYFRKAHVRRYK
jgi:FkbM family methyltransferase